MAENHRAHGRQQIAKASARLCRTKEPDDPEGPPGS
jgi:hypothetical protein